MHDVTTGKSVSAEARVPPMGADLEYKSLRDEILLRINLRQQLMWYTLTFSGVVLGFGLQVPRVALVYPPLAFFLALAWLQNDYKIRNLSAYIRINLEPAFAAEGWETTLRRRRDSGVSNWRMVVFSHAGVCVVTQSMALGVALTAPHKTPLEWALFTLGALAAVGALLIWRQSMETRLRQRP
jgi:hypothetical protein